MKLDRLLGILTLLLQNDRVTAPYLAERFEVTRRTIGRDIDALCRAGIPVVTRQGGGGGISIAEGYKLDKSVLTESELSYIIAALRGLGTVTEKTQVERILDKFSAGGKSAGDAVVSLRESIVIDLSSDYTGAQAEKIEAIKRAIGERRLIEFDYYYEKGQSRRCVEPYFIAFTWADWYVFGYCLSREDWRTFKLARLWNLTVCGEGFVPRAVPPERARFGTHFTDEHRLTARFDPSAEYQVIETYGPDSYTRDGAGGLILKLSYTNREFILRWLLSFGDKVRVVEPADMATEMRGIAESMVRVYAREGK